MVISERNESGHGMGKLEEKQKLPLISVGIPTYSRPEGLRHTLDCITGQTYKNLEIIVSDNASPGVETEEVVREFMEKDARIKYFRQSVGIPVIDNFMTVLEKAQGSYFMWAADDDSWDSDWIEKLIRSYRPNAVLYFGRLIVIDNEGKNKHPTAELEFSGGLILRSLKFAFQDEFRGKANLFYGLFRTVIIREELKKGMKDCFASDVLLLYSVLQHGEFVEVQDTKFYKKLGGAGDRVSHSYAPWVRASGSYLIPYYAEYIRRSDRVLLKIFLLMSFPYLLLRANVNRISRFFINKLNEAL